MNIKQVLFLAAFGLTASATFTSCDDVLGEWSKPAPVTPTPTPTPTTVSVTSITLSETTLNKKVGDAAVTLTATVAPDNADDKTITWSSDNTAAATVADGVVTIVGTGTALIAATAKDGSGVEATCTVNVGLLAGKFSVDDGKQVQFSQGNLQYQASTKTWRFAENQYGYVDNAPGNTTSTGRDTQSDWIDLFGWGTAGHSFASGYGTLYQPWETDNTDGTKYGPSGTDNGLYGDYAQGDWGTNMGTGWRTLKSDEWTYLFQTRTDAANKFGYATVAGKNGIIIVPDEFTDPMKNGGSNAFVGSTTIGFNANVYTEDNWTAMEAAGCVFLPAAGGRNGTSVFSAGLRGLYWSSSPYGSDANYAYDMLFSSSGLNPADMSYRHYGFSVRLVRPVE